MGRGKRASLLVDVNYIFNWCMCNVNTACFDCGAASCPVLKQIFPLIRQSLLQVAASPRTCPACMCVRACVWREKAHESIWFCFLKKIINKEKMFQKLLQPLFHKQAGFSVFLSFFLHKCLFILHTHKSLNTSIQFFFTYLFFFL